MISLIFICIFGNIYPSEFVVFNDNKVSFLPLKKFIDSLDYNWI